MSAPKRRGEVWLLEMPSLTPHPAVILTRDPVAATIERPTVALITSKQRGIPSEVTIDRDDGALNECYVNLDNVFPVEHYHLTEKLYDLPLARMAEICEAITAAFGCPGRTSN